MMYVHTARDVLPVQPMVELVIGRKLLSDRSQYLVLFERVGVDIMQMPQTERGIATSLYLWTT